MNTTPLPEIILASTSVFRKALLEKLHIPFSVTNPDIDETPLPNESVHDMVSRLSLEKARKISSETTHKIIIASDQSAVFNNISVGKPHSHEQAVKQLSQFSGQTIEFLTGLVVIDQIHQKTYQTLETTKITFRKLSKLDIENYLQIEQPYNCAGSFKSEGLGITLFDSIESTDPNTLIGLPLIKLTEFLRKAGIQIPYRPPTSL